MITHESYISGSRWAGVYELLLDIAATYSVQYRTIEEKKGWFTTTIQYAITGEPANVQRFFRCVPQSIEAHNQKLDTKYSA